MRAAAEILNIGRIGRNGAGLLGVGPGLLIRRLAGRFVERDDALARLRYVGAGAKVLQIRRICRGGAGLLGVGPGLLVGLLARLLVRRLLLLLCLLRIRGLAASRRQGSPSADECHDRQFRKCDASRAPELLTPMTAHAWPFSRFYTRASVPSTPTRIAGSICPETPEWSKDGRPRLLTRAVQPFGRTNGAGGLPLLIAPPLADSSLARLRCAAPCQSRCRATWPPSK